MSGALKALLRSRKFLLAVLDVIVMVALEGLQLAPGLWEPINAIILILIGAITAEDFAEKFGAARRSSS